MFFMMGITETEIPLIRRLGKGDLKARVAFFVAM